MGFCLGGNAEAEIRKTYCKRKWIKRNYRFASQLVLRHSIPACIIVIDKENAEEREGVFMMDASKRFVIFKDGNKNRLRERKTSCTVDAFQPPVGN
jgi:type I restriction enzyme M protein